MSAVISCEWLEGLLDGDYDFTVYSRKNARAELAQLRATVSTLTAERDIMAEAVRHATHNTEQITELMAQNAEQARQLEAARCVIVAYRGLPTSPKGYTSWPLFDLHNLADEWLSANAPAPQAESISSHDLPLHDPAR